MLDKFIDSLIAELPNTELSAKQHQALLFALVSQFGLPEVLETLAAVCLEKADLMGDRDGVEWWLKIRGSLLSVVKLSA